MKSINQQLKLTNPNVLFYFMEFCLNLKYKPIRSVLSMPIETFKPIPIYDIYPHKCRQVQCVHLNEAVNELFEMYAIFK